MDTQLTDESASSIAAVVLGWLAKAAAAPGVIGILGGAIGFLFMWPASAREGFARIVASGICSHFFGPAVLRTIVHFAEWIPVEEMRAGAMLIAALPGWWIFGGLFKWLGKNQDIKQMADDVIEVVKK